MLLSSTHNNSNPSDWDELNHPSSIDPYTTPTTPIASEFKSHEYNDKVIEFYQR